MSTRHLSIQMFDLLHLMCCTIVTLSASLNLSNLARVPCKQTNKQTKNPSISVFILFYFSATTGAGFPSSHNIPTVSERLVISRLNAQSLLPPVCQRNVRMESSFCLRTLNFRGLLQVSNTVFNIVPKLWPILTKLLLLFAAEFDLLPFPLR